MVKNLQFNSNLLHIIETGKLYGNMNTAKSFYPDSYTPEDRKRVFLERRMKLGKDVGFDGRKMFMADQETKTGTWFEIDNDYVEANPDGWSDIPQDILIITDKTPGTVIGHPIADCPVVMAFDKKAKVAAIAHCSAELVDKKMPMLVIDALLASHGSSDEDIEAYVSACAGKSWTYDKYPAWAQDDKIWDDVITYGDDGLYHIDLKSAVLKQLQDRNIKDIIMNPDDTITNDAYYSNSAGRNDESKKGRNFSGLFFK